MSAHDMQAHASGHGGHGSLRSYAIGFVLAVILTVLPFWAVMTGAVTGGSAVALVMGTAAVQMVVHLIFFLHVDGSSDRWTLLSLLFTAIVLVILVGGSLWVMYHLDHNMMAMPMSMTE
ncbi:cytochrome o ubiquinol oxidase subunit IV [Sphingomonas oleivorans]|uniref:Cytochrome bo(3) ubiquinol oxidase subunit 4 n=1 Tax=Sphingomonas oleivorans TaxID=1735121 RepID=A0A2T5G2B1_9SPHN|nr:cytochrome o ubiquinol oxidase subunit IV [Sphingomonas oleivorans]PTQ13293.1 cytochrome o ubiquinol oxidase subunit IV [Sphingomonas oleivorans]